MTSGASFVSKSILAHPGAFWRQCHADPPGIDTPAPRDSPVPAFGPLRPPASHYMQPETAPELSLPSDLQRDLALIVLSILGQKGEGLPRDRAFWETADRALSRMRELGLDRDTLRPSAGSTHPRSLSLSGS